MDADVIVIGIGGMGSAACLQLAKAGANVIGIEQFEIGHALGSSHGETRIFRQAYFEHPNYVPLLKRSRELWRQLEKEAKRSLYEEVGLLYFGSSSSPLLKGVLNSADLYGLTVEKLDRTKRETLGRFFQEKQFEEVLFEPRAGFLHVEACVIAQAEQAKQHGCQIFTSEKVLEWKADSSGVQVKTDKGKYSAKKLVVAGGPWMGEILNDLSLPLTILRKVLLWVDAEQVAKSENQIPCYLFELPNGSFYGFPPLGPKGKEQMKLAEHSGGRKVKHPSLVDRSLTDEDVGQAQFFIDQALSGVGRTITRHEVCMYTSTPDENFILDIHPKHPNVVIASCCSGHGFKFAPVIGEAIKDLALQGRTDLPIEFLKLNR